MRADQLAIAVATPVSAGALYLLLAGEVSIGEVIACAAAVALASGYAFARAGTASVPMRLPLRAVPVLGRAARSVIPDTLRVGRALLAAFRGAEGSVCRQAFHFGGDNPADAGRRACVVIAISLAPNGYVLGAEDDGDLVLHRLHPAPPSDDREWPG